MTGDETGEQSDGDGDGASASSVDDLPAFLDELGFGDEELLLTRRQVEVLVLREHGHTQAEIAKRLGTSRENVTGIERRARENIDKARNTVAFVERMAAPVRVDIPADTDLYDAPELIFDGCDEKGIKIPYNAPELMKLISDGAGEAVDGRRIRTALQVSVTSDGTVRIRTP